MEGVSVGDAVKSIDKFSKVEVKMANSPIVVPGDKVVDVVAKYRAHKNSGRL